VSAIECELDARALGGPASGVETIYFGGGTPSRLGPEAIARLIDVVAKRFVPVSGAEITLEANPDDVDAASVAAWRAAGVNRVSLGVQSFDDRALAWMHRTHDTNRVTAAAEALGRGGIENWSLDLIFALPASLDRDWTGDLESAIALRPPHISLYGLTVEAHTPIARWRERGASVEGSEDAYEAEYLKAHELLGAAGYDHYEVSNFGRPGHLSRHNRGYWSGASYVGLGPAAHGFDGTVRRWNEREYAAWLRLVKGGVDPMAGSELLSDENRIAEEVYLGLRTTDGLPIRDSDRDAIRPWLTAGWADATGDRLRLSASGWLRLDALAASLTAIRSR
jgi:oxygen-independent coproporphyrinogen-3 oxidase